MKRCLERSPDASINLVTTGFAQAAKAD